MDNVLHFGSVRNKHTDVFSRKLLATSFPRRA